MNSRLSVLGQVYFLSKLELTEDLFIEHQPLQVSLKKNLVAGLYLLVTLSRTGGSIIAKLLSSSQGIDFKNYYINPLNFRLTFLDNLFKACTDVLIVPYSHRIIVTNQGFGKHKMFGCHFFLPLISGMCCYTIESSVSIEAW